jgi:hypothetical protein
MRQYFGATNALLVPEQCLFDPPAAVGSASIILPGSIHRNQGSRLTKQLCEVQNSPHSAFLQSAIRKIALITLINELIGNWMSGPRATEFEQQLQTDSKVKEFVQTTTTACHSF